MSDLLFLVLLLMAVIGLAPLLLGYLDGIVTKWKVWWCLAWCFPSIYRLFQYALFT